MGATIGRITLGTRQIGAKLRKPKLNYHIWEKLAAVLNFGYIQKNFCLFANQVTDRKTVVGASPTQGDVTKP